MDVGKGGIVVNGNAIGMCGRVGMKVEGIIYFIDVVLITCVIS